MTGFGFNLPDGDWVRLRQILQQIGSYRLGPESSPTFGDVAITSDLSIGGSLSLTGTLTLSGLTASRLTATNASKQLVSSDLSSWVAGTTNRITVTDDTDGTITLTTPQDIHTGASPSFAGLTLSGLTQNSIPFIGAGGIISEENGNFTYIPASNTLSITDGAIAVVGTPTSYHLLLAKAFPSKAFQIAVGDTEVAFTSSLPMNFGDRNVTSTGTWSLASLNLATPLSVANGGTGLSTIAANRIPYATALDTIGSSANLTFGSDILTVNGLSLASGSITDTTGAISFGNENLTTTGNLTAEDLTINGKSTFTDNTTNTSYIHYNGTNYTTITSGYSYGIYEQTYINNYAATSSANYIGGAFFVNGRVGYTTNLTGICRGLYGYVAYQGIGTMSNARGLDFSIINNNAGTITNAVACRISFINANASGVINSLSGVEILNPSNAGTIANFKAISITNVTAGSTNYAIYSEGGQSVHAGNFRIGSNVAPTVALDVTGAALISTTLGITGLTTATAGIASNGDIKLNTAGNGLYIKGGTNATMGVVTLVLGVATVSTTKVTANSRIFLTTQGGTLTNVAAHYVSARTAGTSFVITSMNLLDVSDVAWIIIETA